MQMRTSKTRKEPENITVPKRAFDDLLGKMLKSPPLPKAAIPAKKERRRPSGNRQSSGETGREK